MVDRNTALKLANEGLASVREACEFLDVKRTRLYQLNRDRVIPFVRMGKTKKIPWVALKEYVARLVQAVN